jgi:SAM-dependent methyltransferase
MLERGQTNLDTTLFRNWTKFLKNHFKASDKILDFGPGHGHAIYLAKKLGFNNIIGLDIDMRITHNDSTYFDHHKKYGISKDIIFYSGSGRLPFEDDEFSSIIFQSSIIQDNSLMLKGDNASNLVIRNLERLEARIKELIRISCSKAIWYISPPKHWKAIESMFFKHNKKSIVYKDLSKFFR